MEIITTKYIDSCVDLVNALKKAKIKVKERYVEDDFSAYIDYMRLKIQKLPVLIRDDEYINTTDLKTAKKFYNGKIKGEHK